MLGGGRHLISTFMKNTAKSVVMSAGKTLIQTNKIDTIRECLRELNYSDMEGFEAVIVSRIYNLPFYHYRKAKIKSDNLR